MRDQRTKLALKLACLFVFPLELQLVSQSLLRTMELNHFWMNIPAILRNFWQHQKFTKKQKKSIRKLSKWIFYVKSHFNLSDFFSLWNRVLGAHFLLKWFFGNFNFKTTCLLISIPIFDQAAKLGKSSRDAYNPGFVIL